MKKQILNLVSILSLVIAVISLAIGLGNTQQQLLKAEARIRLLEFDNITKTAENIRLDCELAEAKTTAKKWAPEWIRPGILKPIEPKDLREEIR